MIVNVASWWATVRSTVSVCGAPTNGVIAMPRSGALVNTGNAADALETDPSAAWNVAISVIWPLTPATLGLAGMTNTWPVCPGASVRELDGPCDGSSPFQTPHPCGQLKPPAVIVEKSYVAVIVPVFRRRK